MKKLFKAMEVIGVTGFFFMAAATGETLSETIMVGILAIAFLLIALAGWKGVESEENCKVHDCTSKRSFDASYPSYLRK